MSKEYDKPIFLDVKIIDFNDKDIEKKYVEEIKNLCADQAFAVLATYGANGTSASLISFAVDSDLRNIVFMTPRNTAKYDHILENPDIAMLIDNRSDRPDSINQISALTISGTANAIVNGDDIEKWTDLFLKKHPNLLDFAHSPSTAAIIIDVKKCVFVSKFQEVFEWHPDWQRGQGTIG